MGLRKEVINMVEFDRHRRLRSSVSVRALVRETHLNKDDLIMPVFVDENISGKQEIKSMPGIYQFGLDTVLDEVHEIVTLGIKAIILFGIPAHKDEVGTDA